MKDTAIERLASYILDGSAMLFVGAGLSFLSRNTNNDLLPNGEKLKADLHNLAGAKKAHQLDKIAQFYIKKFGPAQLYEFLSAELTVSSVDTRLIDLYRQPWRRIYTTNYDDAIEFARKPTRGSASFSLGDPLKTVPDGAIVHINGYIKSVTPQSIASDLKLTDLSYATSNFDANKEWSQFFRNDLRVSRAIFFVGYSLADLDIARILLSETALRDKTLFYIAPDDEVEEVSLEPYGRVITSGIDALFDTLEATKASYEPPAVSDSMYSLTELRARPEIS